MHLHLDDDLVERIDELARNERSSRSAIPRRGALAVSDPAEQDEADRALRDSYRRMPQDPALVASARRLAARTAPAWSEGGQLPRQKADGV